MYNYDLTTTDNRRQFQYDWDAYFGRISPYADRFTTTASSLIVDTSEPNALEPQDENNTTATHTSNLTALGDEGELFVYEYEKKRVSSFNQRLANKVLSLGKTKGLGYDIQSVIAEPGDMAEFVKYIEVKSTKRLTCPDVNDDLWIDTLNITRNEWVAAQQHKDFYSIFRVYFTREGVSIFVLKNPMRKYEEGKLQITPMTYRMDFSNKALDEYFIGIQKEDI